MAIYSTRQDLIRKLQETINMTKDGQNIRLIYGTFNVEKKEHFSEYIFTPCKNGIVHPEYVQISDGERHVIQCIEKDNGLAAVYDIVDAVKKFVW